MKIVVVEHPSAMSDACADIIAGTDIGRNYFPTRELLTDAIAAAAERHELHAAVDDAEVAGVLWFQMRGMFDTFPYLHIIAVDEARRGRGVGSLLMDHFEKTARDGRLRTKVFLLSAADNAAAHAFYERRGYQKICEIKGLFRKGITEQLYMKQVRA